MLLLGLQVLVPGLPVQVMPYQLLQSRVGACMPTEKDISLHLVIEQLKLPRLFHLVAVEVFQVFFIRDLFHAKKNIIPLGVKPSQVVTFEL